MWVCTIEPPRYIPLPCLIHRIPLHFIYIVLHFIFLSSHYTCCKSLASLRSSCSSMPLHSFSLLSLFFLLIRDVMKLQIRVDDNGTIIETAFKTFGCGSAQASSSLASEWIKGKTLDEVLEIRNTYLVLVLYSSFLFILFCFIHLIS